MRKISNGTIGGPILGSLTVADNDIQSQGVNADINLSPNGTGNTVINSDLELSDNSGVQLHESSGNGTNYIQLKAPAAVTANVTITFPDGAGTNGYALVTDGSGNLSWSSPSLAVTDQNADAATYYPIITTSNSGNLTGVNVSSSKLTYQPSTGTLSTTTFSGNLTSSSVNIDGGTIDGTSIGASSRSSIQCTTLNANGAVTLGDATGDTITMNGYVGSNIIPTGTRDLGSSGNRWNNLYVNDLSLSNGIGDYTIVEGEEDLFLYNNKNGKVYRFMTEEVDPGIVPPKKDS